MSSSSGRRRRPSATAIALVAAPASAAALAAVVVLVRVPATNVLVQTPLWATLLTAGLVGSAVLAVPGFLARRAARARERGAEEAGRAAAADHRRFLLRLDHELKNPVTAIQAGLGNLDQVAADGVSCADAATMRPALDSIAAQARRLANLVADLRKLAELETRPIERSPVDLGELLEEVTDAISEIPGAADRTVRLSLPQAPWPLGTVPGDRDLLLLAVHNLLVNAVKFTRPGDMIEVRARDEGDQVIVEVADTGVGVPAEEIGQIWDELARGSAARGTPGMGLGLALVRAVAARHGGTVWVRSRAGHGTAVGVRLPTA